MTYLKKIPGAELHICLVFKMFNLTSERRIQAKNVFYFRGNSCSGCLIQMFTQSSMWPEIDMQPLPGGSELIWYAVAHFCVIFVLTFCFIMQQVSNRLPERADRKRERDKEYVTSQRGWLLMCRYMRECWGALKLKSDARLSTQLDFKEAGSEWDIVEIFAIERDRKEVTQAVLCAV